eukprot:TRINITY_DN27208_c0_g1_i1.p1 TRINITY_DN27208_c0_g1~~TRINITY_DN27208_c0_g1_i1.p1  ORF type:complete len:223 (+),score=70.67 TRINITY_DN27208_c0_g1_i1:99-767(+)
MATEEASNGEGAVAEAVAPAASTSHLQELAAIRQRHHARYQEREEAAEQEQQEAEKAAADAALADKLAKEEEEARQKQLEADEEYSRQLAAQLNPGGQTHPLQTVNSGTMTGMTNVPLEDSDSELAAHYQQLEDGEAEGYRAPMRTGYVDRLIEPAQDRIWDLMQAARSAQRGSPEDLFAREPIISAAHDEAPLPSQSDFTRYVVPIVALATVAALGALLSS